MKGDIGNQSFWDHIDALRIALLKSLAITLVFCIIAFCFKKELFDIILAPQSTHFITYRVLNSISQALNSEVDSNFSVKLISTGLAEQFLIHMQAAFCVGILGASPYILYQLFRFVSPALYTNERKYVVRVVGGGYALFALGVGISYFLIFPLTFRFLGDYHVSAEVENMVALQSYISALITLSLAMGIVFEIPVLSWLFAKLGFISSSFMRRYRRHAIVIILIIAAIITPTSDVFTLSLVATPMWLLYETSILIVKQTERKGAKA